ncbi:hypothetical protein REPUB_Repub07fG0158300 [Reevesia pubescens]
MPLCISFGGKGMEGYIMAGRTQLTVFFPLSKRLFSSSSLCFEMLLLMIGIDSFVVIGTLTVEFSFVDSLFF